MTENAEEVSIAHFGVAFEHQLHEIEQSKSAISGRGAYRSNPVSKSAKF